MSRISTAAPEQSQSRFGSEAPLGSEFDDSGGMARVVAVMFAAGCLTGLIGAASAEPSAPAASWIAAGAAGVLGIGIWIVRDRMSPAAVTTAIFLSSAMVSSALIFDADDSARILYVLPMVLIGAYGSWRSLLALAAVSGAGYAVALLSTAAADPVDPDLGIWINTIGVSTVAGSVVRVVKQRLDVHLRAVLVLARALDLRDSGTAAHSETVGHYAAITAEGLGLPRRRVRQLRLAGVLHDVGKIGVSDLVLNKPGPLSEEEWRQMRRHPELGAELLRGAGLATLAEWIGSHHERPDGSGYPRGLGAEEIPIEARIIAVADTYEAMLADRCYSAGMPDAEARAELRRVAGTQLDPDAVAALLERLPAAATRAGQEGQDPARGPLVGGR